MGRSSGEWEEREEKAEATYLYETFRSGRSTLRIYWFLIKKVLVIDFSRCDGAQPYAPVDFDQMVVNRVLVELFVTDVAPVSIADRALNMVASEALDGGGGASGAFGHVRSFDGRRPAVLANKVARRAERHFGLAGAGDRTDLFDLGATCNKNDDDGNGFKHIVHKLRLARLDSDAER